MSSPHFQACPGAGTGFVFICPGRFEAARGCPCAAGTGANLARALVVLHERLPACFPSPSRDKYVITNSWEKVEYPALTHRSVPTLGEVLAAGNLSRLAAELASLQAVIACGALAHAAVQALADCGAIRARLAFGRHLSQRAVNMIAGAADTPGRVGIWCDGVIAQLSEPERAGAQAAGSFARRTVL